MTTRQKFSRRRNTPTGVGKTRFPALRDGLRKKHPHGRGEDYRDQNGKEHRMETPPRAWGRLT